MAMKKFTASATGAGCMTNRPRVAVMLSGSGTNFAAIADYADRAGTFDVDHVISDQPDAGGLSKARDRNIAISVIERDKRSERAEHDRRVGECLRRVAPDVIALAGYMRILGPTLVEHWRGRMLNVHPSLLPKYPGLHTYRRALEDGAAEHGASVHFVTEQLDGGPVIAQARTRITAEDTEQTLRNKVQGMEYTLFPRVIEAVCLGHARLSCGDDGHVLWHGAPLAQPLDAASLREHAA
jgi:phosphoribosylglycinamide formyltransferase-1